MKHIYARKRYQPKWVTEYYMSGVKDFDFVYGIIERMEKHGHARNIETSVLGNRKRVDFDRKEPPKKIKIRQV